MTATDKPRRRWPPALIPVSLLLLVGATVATAHLAWNGLRNGLAQMRTSVATAQHQQQRLMARLRAAEVALAERAAEPASPATQPKAAPPLRRSLPALERGRLIARLRELELAAGRLPSARPSARRATAARPAKQLLREQLSIAAAAVASGDLQLLDAALFAATRLTGAPHRNPDQAASELAQQLAALRGQLRVSAAVGGGATRLSPPAPAHTAAPSAEAAPAVRR